MFFLFSPERLLLTILLGRLVILTARISIEAFTLSNGDMETRGTLSSMVVSSLLCTVGEPREALLHLFASYNMSLY
ncbi:hypothetical protein BDF14DRAFT_976269 [Spinellus fusiger]|nr:hypothetical protein BDF14DRAFT_976269 [Spinellus fusiger]